VLASAVTTTDQRRGERLTSAAATALHAAEQVRLLGTLRQRRLASRGLESGVLQRTLQRLGRESVVVTVGHFNVLSTKKSERAIEKYVVASSVAHHCCRLLCRPLGNCFRKHRFRRNVPRHV
jgi:hypothetical protein